jgi:ATP-dependent Zn protease
MVSGTPWETVSLTALSRDRTLFPSLLAEARDAALRGQEGRLVVHTAWGTEWRPFGLPRRKRPLRSVVLAPGVGEKIVEDVGAFLGRREWYADRGVSRMQERKVVCFNLASLQRHSVSQRIFASRSAGIGKIVVHTGSRWLAVVRHMPTESLRTWFDR